MPFRSRAVSSPVLAMLVLLMGACSSSRQSVAPPSGEAQAAGKPKNAWNDAEIAWRPAKEGLEEARRLNKPVCLVVFTTWCPHCTAYSKVFADPRIVEASKQLVMIRTDQDLEPELASRFAPDGQYIPRTLFLSPDGTRKDIRAQDGEYAFYYDEEHPEPLLEALGKAAQ